MTGPSWPSDDAEDQSHDEATHWRVSTLKNRNVVSIRSLFWTMKMSAPMASTPTMTRRVTCFLSTPSSW